MLFTVAETDAFKRYSALIWSDNERIAFVNWIAGNSLAGDVIPGSGGCRKVRWNRFGMGKRGGVRVIYFNGADGRIWLLIVYTKAKFDNLPAHFLLKLKAEVELGSRNVGISK
ncbi:transcriptional regulator [Chromatium weissei]|nr:transcriptional regulator [Chromatium weissei]